MVLNQYQLRILTVLVVSRYLELHEVEQVIYCFVVIGLLDPCAETSVY
jgi:hypothetical protein